MKRSYVSCATHRLSLLLFKISNLIHSFSDAHLGLLIKRLNLLVRTLQMSIADISIAQRLMTDGHPKYVHV